MITYVLIILSSILIFYFIFFFKKEGYKNISLNEKYLYCFICNKTTKPEQFIRIKKMMINLDLPYIICIGGYKRNFYDINNNIIFLNCDDKYCGLPDKVVKLFRFIVKNPVFDNFTHFVKLDEDMIIHKPIDKVADYLGYVQYTEGNRNYHIGKCKGYKWNNIPYNGRYVPWCLGGRGYMISRKSAKIISNINTENDMLEDIMVGRNLEENKIKPINFKQIKEYITSIIPYKY
jgi:hypothetical protein